MSRRAMVLAAGRGERMRPLTDRTPKPLLEAGGRPLVEHVIERLRRAGMREIVVNTAWLGEQLVDRLGDGARLGVTITWSPEPEGALEAAGGIVAALPRLGDAPFVAVNADVWSDYPLEWLSGPLGGLAHLVMVDNPAFHPAGDFRLDGGRLEAHGEPRLTYSGIGLFHPDLFRELAPGRRPLAPLLREAMAAGAVSGEHYRGAWHNVGTPAQLAALDAALGADPA